ncbi:MAG: hypothetical protein ACOCQ7_02265 [Natronomonas sp.]
MSLDIGRAFGEGFSRTIARNGLVLVVVFAVIAFLTTVLVQSVAVGVFEALYEFFTAADPSELGIPPEQYETNVQELETALDELRSQMPLALPISAGIASAGLFVLALVSEAVSIVAVRVFASDETRTIPSDLVTRNILLATLNGFVGGIVVWGLIAIGLAILVIPGVFLAVAFFFLRQEIAIEDKNFVQAMADSWRITKGHRIEVFAIGLVVVIVSQLEIVAGFTEPILTSVGSAALASILAGILGVFGAAVVTRTYVQIDDGVPRQEPEDPYDAALGPEDL